MKNDAYYYTKAKRLELNQKIFPNFEDFDWIAHAKRIDFKKIETEIFIEKTSFSKG